VARATTTTVGNAWLHAYARRFSSSVCVIPTTIDVQQYTPGTAPHSGAICIGWSGSHSTSKHLHTIDTALSDALRHPAAALRVIGDPTFHLDGGAGLRATPWRRETELDDLRTFDIGIMPLPDDEWSKGRCGLKALQYMALAIP